MPVLVAGAAIVSCAVGSTVSCMPDYVTYDLDPRFTTVQREQALAEMERWNGIATKQAVVSTGGEWKIRREAPPAGFVGWTAGKDRVVLISPDAEDVSWILRHELGHTLGLEHVCHGVMWGTNPPPPQPCPDGAGSETFTAEDMAECRRVGACE